jgi:hypothetical protein
MDMRRTLEDLTEDEFETLKSLEGEGEVSFSIHQTRCDNGKCFVTYEVERSLEKDGNKYEEVSKKIAEVIDEDGKWKISDISNVKSYIEILNELRIGSE